MARPSVAIVVLNYNGRGLLERYLPSILALDYDPVEVVVADNASTDDSLAFLADVEGVTVVETGGNVGYSQGYNRAAARLGDYDYLWLLDNDVRVEPDSLGRLVDHMEANPGTGLVVPRINDMGTDRIQSLGFHYDRFGRSFPKEAGRTIPSNPDPHPVTYGMGPAMLVRREVWEAVGGFDDRHFMYGDDDYLGLQTWLRGYRVEVVPESVVYHERENTDGSTLGAFDVYQDSWSRTRTYLKSLQASSLLVGLPVFCALVAARAGKDLAVRTSPGLAFHRLLGVYDALLEAPELLRDRRAIQRERVLADREFLDPVRGE
ncbi:glycosyltransferase family 2 protein [Halomarina litorea]|uniref:glycosyltransferase family 2 protein n=1 Tax=Halomarina litorea TaxID=2961595 RepID=UPI0020C34E63|nr:glycosyltransferase family 2 protein [Halomarina sp. BCD28]